MSHNENISKETRDKWKYKVERCLDSSLEFGNELQELTEWEYDFCVSIQKRLNDGKDLSWKQSQTLNKIFEKIDR